MIASVFLWHMDAHGTASGVPAAVGPLYARLTVSVRRLTSRIFRRFLAVSSRAEVHMPDPDIETARIMLEFCRFAYKAYAQTCVYPMDPFYESHGAGVWQ